MYLDKIIKLGYKTSDNYQNIYLQEVDDIKYSDGDVEFKIHKILKNLNEEGNLSFDSLESYIEDWPTEYHFSWVRQNILKPVKFEKTNQVLELGGGTGIISDYVTKRVQGLITIEGTEIRANCIAERCRSRDNINIIVANFLNLNLVDIFGENSFDKILLIGVLEYVPKYAPSDRENPIEKLLQTCKKLLRSDGELIIAIENKIGLKYLLGREEDHLGISHYGTQSLYKKTDVVTFTKEGIKQRLNKSGFQQTDFLYPFPDYKLPSVIVRDSAYLKDTTMLISSLLKSIKTRNYSGNAITKLQEGRILKNMLDDGILGNLSNSFLIIAKNLDTKTNNDPVIYNFSTHRKYKFANEMNFTQNGNELFVSKKWYGQSTQGDLLNLNADNAIKYKFISGIVLEDMLIESYVINDEEMYLKYLTTWLHKLNEVLPTFDSTFDLLPRNLIITNSNELIFFDTDEWTTAKKLPIPLIVKRFVLTHKEHLTWLYGIQENERNYIQILLDLIGLEIDNRDVLGLVEEIDYFIREEIHINDYNSRNLIVDNKSLQDDNRNTKLKHFIPPILYKVKTKIKKKYFN